MTPSPTNHNTFSNRDLIEMASLDALGLLDEHERQAYEKAFSAAPAAIQQLVRSQQLRVSDMDALLPDVQPRPTLRQRVLSAVASAMKNETSPVVGRITPHLAPSRGVASYWRAAAIGSIAAAVVFGFVTIQMTAQFKQLENAVRTDEVSKEFAKTFGPRFENALMNERTQFLQFASATKGQSASGMAVLLLDPDSKTGQFFCKGLPENISDYTLSVVDSTGKVQTAVLSFHHSDNNIVYQNLKLNTTLGAGSSFVIQSADQTRTVLQSRNL